MTNFNISITSDIVCPWCYIGHARLTRAIKAHQTRNPSDTFHLEYKPFYLSPPPQLTSNTAPAFPVESVARRAKFEAKFGKQRTEQIYAVLSQAAKSEGLDFKFGGKTGDSRNGHRLVYFAQRHGSEKAQNDVMLGLWRRYYEQEVDITRLEVLVEVGVEAGLGTPQEIEEYLVSGKDGEEVDRLAEEARLQQEISGVPHYVLQDTWAVSGAQEPRAFEMLFERYKLLESKNNNTKGGIEVDLNGSGGR